MMEDNMVTFTCKLAKQNLLIQILRDFTETSRPKARTNAMLHQTQEITNSLAINVARGPVHGEPLVLLHGVTRRWQDFAQLLPEFVAGWEVLAIDFRGHGSSARAASYLTVDYVQDIVGLLKRLTTRPAVLYGHSLGAMVAAGVAAELPNAVRALVLEDPPWNTLGLNIQETSFYSHFVGMQQVAQQGGSTSVMSRRMAEIVIKGPHATADKRLGELRDAVSLRFAASCLRQCDPAVLSPIVAGNWLDGYSCESVLSAVQCPTLLLQADAAAGGMLCDDDASRAEKLIRDCVRVRIDGVGHLIHWQARERLLAHVTAFLTSLD